MLTQQNVKDLGIKVVGVVIEDLDNKTISKEFEEYKKKNIYKLLNIYKDYNIKAHDIAKIAGNVTLKITDGSELFIPLGSDEAKEVKAGEYSYVDDSNEIICRLEVRQVNKTKITEDTKNVFYFVVVKEEYCKIRKYYYLNYLTILNNIFKINDF